LPATAGQDRDGGDSPAGAVVGAGAAGATGRREVVVAPTTLRDTAGLLVAICAVAAVVLACRWAFSPTREQRRRRDEARSRRGFGLLVPIAVVPRRGDADHVRRLLDGHGIRATTGPVPPGPVRVTADGHIDKSRPPGFHVLVFPEDADRAAAVVARRRADG
jgi:hypothetical protein